MGFIKQNFQFLVIIALFLVILLQRVGDTGGKQVDPKPIVITIVDTSWKHMVQPPVNVYPTVSNHIPSAQVYKDRDTLYLPSPNDSILREQYKSLRDSLLSKNIYEQTLKYDSSSVTIKDTINQNKIVGRSYSFNLKYPSITTITTIKEPYKPKTQVFVGGGLIGNRSSIVNGASAGIMLKTKSDQVYKVDVIQPFTGPTTYGLSTYWKIKLHK